MELERIPAFSVRKAVAKSVTPHARHMLPAVLFMSAMFPALHVHAQVTIKYIHTDALGSVVAATDASGNLLESEFYEPYGAPILDTPRDQPGFAGHIADAETGLSYMQQRYQDPQLGLFLSVDTVSPYCEPGANFNRYTYSYNNPFSFTDPDGRQSVRVSTAIPEDKLTRADRDAIDAGNKGQKLYEDAVRASGDQKALDKYMNTPVEYRRELSPQAQAVQHATRQSSDGIKAYREPDQAKITILPGFTVLGDKSTRFPGYHGMTLGPGGDATVFQVIGHEHGHVLDMSNSAPHDREAAASEHSNRMKEFAPRKIRRELRSR